ncbi:MAG: hypothetical protein KAS66_05930 [Candidatus Omnitrophica bacterium]|nr:hypothetical protein [Candidatus Omnitrophota bacterium]
MIEQTFAAFTGAFFAFIFICIGDMLTRLHEYQKRGYNALVELEYYFNENMNTISDNIFVIDDFKDTIEKPLRNNEPAVYGNKLYQISFNNDILLRLNNLDLINKVFEFKTDVVKLNHSIDFANGTYNEIKNAFTQHLINFQTYKINTLGLIEKLEELKKFLKKIQEKNVKLGAYVRVLERSKPLFTWVLHHMSLEKHYSEGLDRKVKEELIKLEKERSDTMDKSQKEIEETHGRK